LTGRRRCPAILAVAGVLLLAAPAVAADPAAGQVEVRGSVADETGAPLPGQAVRVLKSRTVVDLSGRRRTDQDVEEVRAMTDEHGRFSLQFRVDPQFKSYALRFYDPKQFDAVKYSLPQDRDISRRARAGRPVEADVALRPHPDWPKVKEMIERCGAASHCGQVLRALGLPSRRVAQGAGRELWEYDSAGVAYLVEGPKVLETRRLERAGQAGPPPDGSGPDRPQPATRVEEP
jgi:hypothetical protein